MIAGRSALLAVGALAACATPPRDPLVVAERALAGQDLAAALGALDAVPVAHPRYPEARASAVAVERDMRRCHELMLEALLLRSEWRDDEALEVLRQARAVWSAMPGIDVMIAATEQRRLLFTAAPPRAATPVAPAPAAETVAVEGGAVSSAPETVATPAPEAAAPAPEVAVAVAPAAPDEAAVVPPVRVAEPAAAPVTSPVPAAAPAADVAATGAPSAPKPAAAPEVPVGAEDSVALGLVAVELRLGRGQLEAAVVDLLELARRFPADARVRGRLVRVLHQRALLCYGQGNVAMAISDWQRLLELDPEHRSARRMLDAARSERN